MDFIVFCELLVHHLLILQYTYSTVLLFLPLVDHSKYVKNSVTSSDEQIDTRVQLI